MRRTDTWRQARSLTPGTSSSRSPDAVVSAHSRSRATSAPNRDAVALALVDGEERVVLVGNPPSTLCTQT